MDHLCHQTCIILMAAKLLPVPLIFPINLFFHSHAASSKEITCKVAHPFHTARSLRVISDFPNLVKCIQNAFVSKALQLPSGHAYLGAIKAWKRDMDDVTLKVMPHISKAHLGPNAFEKMQVNLAFQLFCEKVLKGLLIYKNNLAKILHTTDRTHQANGATDFCPVGLLKPSNPDEEVRSS